ncbi:MAG: hypothetical protein QXH80_00400 [Candidatus Nanoarchaeia archaeon]
MGISRHQHIGDIQTAMSLQELVDEGREFTDSIEFSRRDAYTVPELVRIAHDVREDLSNNDPRSAYTKLDWYFNRGPLAHARTEEDFIDSLAEGVSGAYAVDTEKYVEAQIGLYQLYEKFKEKFGPIKGYAPEEMYT